MPIVPQYYFTVIFNCLLFSYISTTYSFHTFCKVINHQPYDQKADVFSFAIVLWELVTAKVCAGKQNFPSLSMHLCGTFLCEDTDIIGKKISYQ